MKINIQGGGWYGCHLASALRGEHDVRLTEKGTRLFSGASGANPARLHMGPHYPRSQVTRRACQIHSEQFLAHYGHLTRAIGQNIYAIADKESLVDFGTYRQILKAEIQVLDVHDTFERGLRNVEGAIQVSERHIVIDLARAHFEDTLAPILEHGTEPTRQDADLTIDCTFCSVTAVDVERFEPCVTALMHGPTDTAITIMDGPFPSLYPWNEDRELCSLTSAKLTPLAKCSTWNEADDVLKNTSQGTLIARVDAMIEQMAYYYPSIKTTHKALGWMTSIRAMPKSASDARLVQVADGGERLLRIRAGKIDAIFEAEVQVRKRIEQLERQGGAAMILCTGIGSTIMDAVKDLRPEQRIFKIENRTSQVYDFTEADPDTRIILAAGYLAGLSNEDHTTETSDRTLEENFTKPMNIAQQVLAELPAARVCVIGSMSANTGSYDQQYALAKSMMHRWVLRQKTIAPRQLVVVAPPIIADSGMTRRRADYPGILKTRNHCYAADVAREVVRLLWGEVQPMTNNTVVFVEPTVKVEGATC